VPANCLARSKSQGRRVKETGVEQVASSAKSVIFALLLGTDHKYQRRQDPSQENEQVRDQLQQFIQEAIRERNVDAIAEEAGNDQEVWEHLRAEEASMPDELKALFGGMEIVDTPPQTIARIVADAAHRPYADIRSPGAETMSIAERDEAMAQAAAERFGTARSVLVIVGEAHRLEVARILHERYGWTTESRSFP
jgi:hypothetical protein